MTTINNLLTRLSPNSLFLGFASVVIISILISIILQSSYIVLLPFLILVGAWFVIYPKNLYFLTFLLIPFSIEIFLPNGLGTDLPTEPLMLAFTGFGILHFILHFHKIPLTVIKHPITTLLLLHIVWILISGIYSQTPIISFKFFLAKLWYVIPFFFLPIYFLCTKKDFRTVFSFLIISITISIIYTMVRHASQGFSFDYINKAAHPIYRNHVNYACLLTLAFPYLLLLRKWSDRRLIFLLLIPFFLVAIYLSYTRAAMIALALTGISYLLIRVKLLRLTIFLSLFCVIIGATVLLVNNKYLDYAPHYERAIAHDKFSNLIEATYKLEDISTMERLYRWVSGIQMIPDHPIMGFGPGSFYSMYTSYTVSSFKTYVSDNPEKSGIHNYYLMILVEQGIIGIAIFLLLCITTLIYGEQLYHRLQPGYRKDLVMTSLCSFIIILLIIIINDMIETDKVGPFFFLAMSILVICTMQDNKKVT